MQVRWMVVAADRARQGNCRIPGNSRSKHIFFIRNAVVRRRTAKSPRARTAAVFIVHRTAAIWFGAVAPGCITKLPLWPRACQPAVSWNVCCTLCTCRSVSDDASSASRSARAIQISNKPVIGQDTIPNQNVCSGGLAQRFSSNLRMQIAEFYWLPNIVFTVKRLLSNGK